MSELLRNVVETTEADHESLLAWEGERRVYDLAKHYAHNMVFGKGWSYTDVCEAIDKLERCLATCHDLAFTCDAARIASLRAHAAAANELGRYTDAEEAGEESKDGE